MIIIATGSKLKDFDRYLFEVIKIDIVGHLG